MYSAGWARVVACSYRLRGELDSKQGAQTLPQVQLPLLLPSLGCSCDHTAHSPYACAPCPAAAEGPWVLPVSDSPKPPSDRITLTMPVLNAAKNVAVVALGQVRCCRPLMMPAVRGGYSWGVAVAALTILSLTRSPNPLPPTSNTTRASLMWCSVPWRCSPCRARCRCSWCSPRAVSLLVLRAGLLVCDVQLAWPCCCCRHCFFGCYSCSGLREVALRLAP